jgi:hypothetical protein
VLFPKNHPYFEAWLRRTGRQFAVSGRLSQIATALAALEGGNVDAWRERLRKILEGEEIPSLDLLTKIDSLLAGPTKSTKGGTDVQESLF